MKTDICKKCGLVAISSESISKLCKKCRVKKWKEDNSEYLKAYAKKWKEANPEYHKAWREANPEYLKACAKRILSSI